MLIGRHYKAALCAGCLLKTIAPLCMKSNVPDHVRTCTKMANRIRVVLFLLLVCLLPIEGRISVPKVKGSEPTVIEIPSGGLLLSLVRNNRQQFSNVSHIGATARLYNDNHNVAVVHWSGFLSEVSRSVL